jgi:hypothetical protein
LPAAGQTVQLPVVSSTAQHDQMDEARDPALTERRVTTAYTVRLPGTCVLKPSL